MARTRPDIAPMVHPSRLAFFQVRAMAIGTTHDPRREPCERKNKAMSSVLETRTILDRERRGSHHKFVEESHRDPDEVEDGSRDL